jgi:negative regulator of sigma E activity
VAVQYPGAVLGLSGELLRLLKAHYVIGYTGRGMAGDRPARIIEIWRQDGSLAARLWLDRATNLPLRRELFGVRGQVISEADFVDLRVGGRATAPPAGEHSWAGRLTAAQLAALRRRGWPLPGRLPDDLMLFDSSSSVAPSGPVVELSYSDGLAVISLFVQRGELPRAMPGWQRTRVAGKPVFATYRDDHSLAWSARGYVYTLIADAGPQQVADAVAALPHDSPPGFWLRIARGFRRIASWLDPFR